MWTTYHPTQTTRERFLSQCFTPLERGARFSVGVVGLREHAAEIAALREALPASVYLWINAYKRAPDYYNAKEIACFTGINPLFPLNNQYHNSLGRNCRTGNSVISVDGDGVMRRCHFVAASIGNLYAPDRAAALRPRLCPNATCGCHIGYIHLPHLRALDTFKEGLLARIRVSPHLASANK